MGEQAEEKEPPSGNVFSNVRGFASFITFPRGARGNRKLEKGMGKGMGMGMSKKSKKNVFGPVRGPSTPVKCGSSGQYKKGEIFVCPA
jgi:hypothetical protein